MSDTDEPAEVEELDPQHGGHFNNVAHDAHYEGRHGVTGLEVREAEHDAAVQIEQQTQSDYAPAQYGAVEESIDTERPEPAYHTGRVHGPDGGSGENVSDLAPSDGSGALHADSPEEVVYEYSDNDGGLYDRKRDVTRIDIEKLGLANPKSPRMGDTRIAEEFRRIKRPLLRNAVNAPPEEMRNLILVTSSVPDEGKTFSALNLALSISLERDRTVLLVDCDLQRNQLTNLLGVSDHPGLTEYLSGQIHDVGDVMLPTLVPNVNFIPSGATTRESAELMASDSMNSLTRELSARYRDRIIIFDSPPLLASNAASVLAHAVGQVILVVEAEATPQKVVVEGLSLIADHDLVGVVLNKRPLRSGTGYRQDYYGYY